MMLDATVLAILKFVRLRTIASHLQAITQGYAICSHCPSLHGFVYTFAFGQVLYKIRDSYRNNQIQFAIANDLLFSSGSKMQRDNSIMDVISVPYQ